MINSLVEEKLYMSEEIYEKGMLETEKDTLGFLLKLYEKNKESNA